MDHQWIEKLLSEKAKLLPEATLPLKIVGDLKSEDIRTGTKRHVFRTASAIAAVFLVSLCVLITANAEIRSAIISFFKADVAENVPIVSNPSLINSDKKIRLIGTQRIEEVADIAYYEFASNARIVDDYVILGQDSEPLRFYKLKNDEAIEVRDNVVSLYDEIPFRGKTYFLDEDYAELGDSTFYKRRTKISTEDLEATIWSRLGSDIVWLNLIEKQENIYPVLYNIVTGEIQDVLEGIVSEDMNIETAVLSKDKTKLMIQEFTGGYSGGYYYFDLNTKGFFSVDQVTGLQNIYFCSFIDNDSLFIVAQNPENSTLTGYRYELGSGKLLTTFQSKDIIFMGLGGSGYVIEKGSQYFTLINPMGEAFRIEGLDISIEYNFLINPLNNKIAVFNNNDSVSGDMGITEIGVIDLEKLELKMFERYKPKENGEISITWGGKDTLVLELNTSTVLYVYQMK